MHDQFVCAEKTAAERQFDRVPAARSAVRTASRKVGVMLLDHGDHVGGHSIGRAQLELAVGIVKHIDRASFSAGKLRRPGDNGVEHRLQVERRVDCLGHVAERAQLLDRLGQIAGAGAAIR